jgi:Flp pilus assembly pilin Flp
MATTHSTHDKPRGENSPGSSDTGLTMSDTKLQRLGRTLGGWLDGFHRDEAGVAMTEYIIVFTLISFGATVALIATAVYIKAYRDFMVWWLGHPAV